MLQAGHGPDLGQEAIHADHRGQLGAQELERNPAAVLQVLREIYPRHASLPKLALEAVLAGQGGGKPLEGVDHRGSMHGGVERDCFNPIVHAMQPVSQTR